MKRFVAAAALAAALALPAGPVAASEAGAPAGIRPCGPMQIGYVVWVANPKTGEPQDLVRYCIPIGP